MGAVTVLPTISLLRLPKGSYHPSDEDLSPGTPFVAPAHLRARIVARRRCAGQQAVEVGMGYPSIDKRLILVLNYSSSEKYIHVTIPLCSPNAATNNESGES